MNTPIDPITTQGAQTASPDPVNSGTQEPNVPNTSASSADSALKPHPKSSLAIFTPEQLAQISTWVQTEKYDKASDLILEKFGHKISTGALFRFLRNTVAIVEQLEDTPQTAAAAAEILQLAANANHKFTEASLHVLEQTAFKLSLTCVHKTSDLDLLNRINNIICRSRNTAVRERHATVQEKKTDLRSRELDLKQQILHARLNGRLAASARGPGQNPSFETTDFTAATPGFRPVHNVHNVHNVHSVHNSLASSDATGSTIADNSNRPKIKILIDDDGETFVHRPGPCPLPDDVVIKNRAYAKKLLAGLIDPDTGEELPDTSKPNNDATSQNTDQLDTEYSPSSKTQHSAPSTQNFLSPEVLANTALYRQKVATGEIRVIYAPGKHFEVEYCNPADTPALTRLHKSAPLRFFEDPTRTDFLPGLRTFGKNPYIPPSSNGGTSPTSTSRDAIGNHDVAPLDQTANIENPENPVHPVQNSSPSAPSASIPVPIPPLSPSELATRVDRYTVDRMREYICHNQNHTPWPYRHPAPEFITEERHCPCGHACPCPTHETIPDVGPFPPIFWKITPFHPDYALCLQDRNLPFRRPSEYLA